MVFGLNDKDDKTLTDDGLVYQIGIIDGKWVASVTQKCRGLSEASRVAESAIKSFEPSVAYIHRLPWIVVRLYRIMQMVRKARMKRGLETMQLFQVHYLFEST